MSLYLKTLFSSESGPERPRPWRHTQKKRIQPENVGSHNLLIDHVFLSMNAGMDQGRLLITDKYGAIMSSHLKISHNRKSSNVSAESSSSHKSHSKSSRNPRLNSHLGKFVFGDPTMGDLYDPPLMSVDYSVIKSDAREEFDQSMLHMNLKEELANLDVEEEVISLNEKAKSSNHEGALSSVDIFMSGISQLKDGRNELSAQMCFPRNESPM